MFRSQYEVVAQCGECHYTETLEYHPVTRRVEQSARIRVPTEGAPWHDSLGTCKGTVRLWTGQPLAFRLLPPLDYRSRQRRAA